MQARGRRPQRVGVRIREELGSLLLSGVRDPRVGFATITEVRVTPDLREARVFVSVLGAEDQRAESLEALRAASSFLRRELSHRLDLRRVPELRFELDRSADYAEHIEELMRQNPPSAENEPEKKEE